MFTKKTKNLPTVTDEAITERAYELWQARGCPESDGSDDWQTAEAELHKEAKQTSRPLGRLLSKFRNRAAV